MATDAVTLREHGFAKTQRRDAWWAGPLVTALVLGGFVIYTTFRIFQNAYFQFGHGTEVAARACVSALADVLAAVGAAGLGAGVDFAGDVHSVDAGRVSADVLLLSQGVLPGVLFGSAGVRGGRAAGPICRARRGCCCFRIFIATFLYVALVFIVILGYDAIHSFIWPTADGGLTFGVSVGSLVLTTGTTLLALYTFSCHSLRHLVGGNVDCFSCVARRADAVQAVAGHDAAQRASHVLGVDEPVWRDACGFVCVDGGVGADYGYRACLCCDERRISSRKARSMRSSCNWIQSCRRVLRSASVAYING